MSGEHESFFNDCNFVTFCFFHQHAMKEDENMTHIRVSLKGLGPGREVSVETRIVLNLIIQSGKC